MDSNRFKAKWLAGAGFTTELHSFQELQSDIILHEKYCYCYNPECTKGSKRVLKDWVSTGQRRCPDCGAALEWRHTMYPKDKNRYDRWFMEEDPNYWE